MAIQSFQGCNVFVAGGSSGINLGIAKAFAANTDGVVTDERVTSTTIQDGARKICIQDIGSSVSNANNAPFNRYGPKTDPQVVVLRGDLVNICR